MATIKGSNEEDDIPLFNGKIRTLDHPPEIVEDRMLSPMLF